MRRTTCGSRVGQRELALQHDSDVILVKMFVSAIREGQKGEAATWLLERGAPIPVQVSYVDSPGSQRGSRLAKLELDMEIVNRRYREHLSQPSISFTGYRSGDTRSFNAGFKLVLQRPPRILQSAPLRRAFSPGHIWKTFTGH